jgi:hypothetical protein
MSTFQALKALISTLCLLANVNFLMMSTNILAAYKVNKSVTANHTAASYPTHVMTGINFGDKVTEVEELLRGDLFFLVFCEPSPLDQILQWGLLCFQRLQHGHNFVYRHEPVSVYLICRLHAVPVYWSISDEDN